MTVIPTLAGDLPDIPFDKLSRREGNGVTSPMAGEPPRPLYRATTIAEPFPIDDMGPDLTPVARAIAEITQAPDAICGNSVLAVASLAVQAHADVILPGSGLASPTSLFIFTIAPSGERKTTADGYALKGIRTRERELRELAKTEAQDYQNRSEVYEHARTQVLRGSKEPEAALARLRALGDPPTKPPKPILVCSEPTSEGLVKLMAECTPTLGLFSSEGGSFIGGHAMNDEAKLRTGARLNSIWDGTPIDRVRAGDGSSVIAGKRVALHLMAQPEAANRFLTDSTLRGLGLVGRFLLSAPAPKAGTRLFREPSFANLAVVNKFAEHIASLLRSIPSPSADGRLRTIVLSDAALRIFVHCYNKTEIAMRPDGKLTTIKPFASKMAEHAVRIAAVISLIADPDAREISEDAMRCGFRLADHYAAEALRLANDLLVSEPLRVAERLRRWLIRHGRPLVHITDLYQNGPTEIRDRASAAAAMKVLEEHGYVLACPDTVVDGVRRKQAWHVNLTEPISTIDAHDHANDLG